MNDLLAGRRALVTGAGRNIGTSLALEMGAQGAEILFTEIDAQRIRRLDHALRAKSVPCRGFLSDVTVEQDVDRLVTSLRRDGAEVDILVNNVGIDPTSTGESWRNTFHDMEKMFGTNVFGPLALTHRVAESMIRRKTGGSILFITSIHQWIVRRGGVYSASKAALGMMIRELALDLAPHGIRVNGIAPGYVGVNDKGKTLPHAYTPLHRGSIEPRYIGRAAVYLASEYFSKRTTGTVVKIDAGLSLCNHLVDQGRRRS